MSERPVVPTRRLGVTLPVEQYERLKRRAELIGVSLADYVRWVLRRACPPDLEAPVALDLAGEWTPPKDAMEVIAASRSGFMEAQRRLNDRTPARRKRRRKKWELAP